MKGTRTKWAMFVSALGLALVSAAALSAQTNEQFDKALPFLAGWSAQVSSPDGQDRGNCGGRTGDYGEKLVNCSMPVGRLPLNSRAEAWLRYKDQLASPTQADCAQIGFPSILGDAIFISAYPGRLVMEHPSNPWHVTRTVWMNGTGPQPLPGELFQHGISRGRFDGDDLIVETDHFTFDPDGIDDVFERIVPQPDGRQPGGGDGEGEGRSGSGVGVERVDWAAKPGRNEPGGDASVVHEGSDNDRRGYDESESGLWRQECTTYLGTIRRPGDNHQVNLSMTNRNDGLCLH